MTGQEILSLIINNERTNLHCIYPVASVEQIGKLISALSNNHGGIVVLGVHDDGIKLRIKGYAFQFNIEDLTFKLSGNAKITFNSITHGEFLINYIEVLPTFRATIYDNHAFTFNNKVKVTELKVKKIFLSYSHNDTCIANLVDDNLTLFGRDRLCITRDIKTMIYKSDIDKFMQTVSEHDFMVSIISDSYLKSRGCMYEISELMRSRKYWDKFMFIILAENDVKYYPSDVDQSSVKADVYSTNRFEYIKYWQDEKKKIDKLNSEITELAYKQGIVEEAKQISIISMNIAELIELLKSSLGIDFSKMLNNEFSEILSLVFEIK